MFARNCGLRTFVCGIIVGFVLVTAIAIWLAIAYWPRPGPPGKIIVAPTPKEERQADLVLEARPAGKFMAVVTRSPAAATKSSERDREFPPGRETATEVSGETARPPETGQNPPLDREAAAEVSRETGSLEGDQGLLPGGEMAEETPAGWMVGDRVETPLQGTLAARVLDKRSGEELGTASVEIAGTIEAYFVSPGVLELRGEFAAEPVTIAINSPSLAANRVGLMYSSTGGLAAYYRHDWLFLQAGRIDVLAWARVTVGQDVREIAVGVEVAL